MPSLNLEYFFYQIYLFVNDFPGFFPDTLFWVKVAGVVLSCLFTAGIVYNILKTIKLRRKELGEFVKIVIEEAPLERANRWNKIKGYGNSDNSSDWRRAILEADSLVEEIITKIGYKGTTFGEKLSRIHPDQFQSLDELWKAHKVRNRVAHESGYFGLSKEQTDKTLKLFEKVLEELRYI